LKLIRKYIYYLTSIARLLFGIQNWPLAIRLFFVSTPSRPSLIRLRRSGVQFRVRGAMDVWIVKETYLDRFYERYGTKIGDGWTVIDIGAGIGDFSLYAALGHPTNKVYAFEPFPESFGLLEKNLQLNRATNVHPFPEAIGGRTGELALDISSGEPLQYSTQGAVDEGTRLTVPCLSLKDAFERLSLAHCNLLKLDCEGAEYDILFKAPASILSRIDHIVMEYHDGVVPANHRDMVEFLISQGFRVRTKPNPVHAHLGFLHGVRAG
jgi:FkbM family methyltransferase